MLIATNLYLFRLYKNFVLSLFVLNLFLFSGIFEPYLGIPKIIKYIFSVFSLYFIFKIYYSSQKLKIVNFTDLLTRRLFIAVSIYLLITSIRFEFFYIQEIFGERYFFLPFLIPIIFILIRYQASFFKTLLRYSYNLLYFGVIIELIILSFFTNETYYARGMTAMFTFSIATFLLVQVSHLLNNKMAERMAYIYLLLFALIAAIWGRRGETLEPIFFILSAFFIKTQSKSIGQKSRYSMILIGVLFSLSAYLIVINNKEKLYIFERGFSIDSFEHSRGETIVNFWSQFGSESNDWLIGRGLNGEFRKFSFGDNQMSRSIEIGYFNILLKGGLLYLIPMMYLFFRAFYLGLFKSNNDLSKGLAMIILWQMIYMVSFGMANYSPYYIIVWIAVGANFDSELRKISNQDLKLLFKS